VKLISCYIENFGGLSRFSLDFSEGVTSVQELNGFGKTTLAEFLRAMFYGFPRKAKSIEKSKRQKYTPWNGGKFGGNLIFEYEGIRYRMERTFGAAPKNDTFRLTDLSTNRKSDRFSEEIGQELFQLDSDSFERSTYMPQLHDASTLTTAGIQAKLGDLVEDANDLGNYDKAVLALRAKRSSFVPYKGSSGSVSEAAANVTRLQRELDQMEAQKAQLTRSIEELSDLEIRLESKKEERQTVEQQKELAAAAENRKLLQKQYAELDSWYQKTSNILAQLKERYPRGIPGREELDKLDELANQLTQLHAEQITTQSDLEAENFLQDQESRFVSGVPTAELLDAAQQKCDALHALTARMEHLVLRDGEQKQLRALAAVAATGMLEEEKLDDLTARNRQLMGLRASLESLAISSEDRQQMKLLGDFFAEGVPTREQLEVQERNLSRCEALRQENGKIAASRRAVPEKPGDGIAKLSLLLGAAGMVAGIVLLILSRFIPCGILLGAGILGLIAGIVLKKKYAAAMEIWQTLLDADAEIQKKLDANEAEAEKLYQQVRAFAGQEPLSEGLTEIRRNLESYLSLRERMNALRGKRSILVEEIDKIDSSLALELEPLFEEVSDYDKAVASLRLARGQYLDLQKREKDLKEAQGELSDEAEQLRRELISFGLEDGDFSRSLASLRRDAERYIRCREQVADWKKRQHCHEKAVAITREQLDDIFAQFGLARQSDLRRQILQLREDDRLYQDALTEEARLHHQLAQFRAEHGEVLNVEAPEQEFDSEHLKWAANRLNNEISLLTRSILEQEHRIAELRKKIDRISEIRDELESWQEKRIADQKKADTLDAAMDFLAKARDSLTTSYLGPIRENFEKLLQRLMGEDQKVFISPDLDVQLERYGEARELGYFSAGQTDLIVLCMRFALVDALFGSAKPFVILDDPFVNLDDQRTAQALQFLRELGQDRQIIYLTCNSSRSL